ncbi:MAG: HU family DNA-binding protein [Desulfobacterales bacterium]|nr:HU family DNA-binding protein [Desulfobacterales bacterium]
MSSISKYDLKIFCKVIIGSLSIEIFKTLLEIIKNSLENGEDVLVSGFGKFQAKDKAPRRGRNPATNDDMVLDARRVVRFKCSGKLKTRLNGAE